MANPIEYTIELDSIDVSFLVSRNEIPGRTVEEKIEWIVSDELRRRAEEVAGLAWDGLGEK